MFCHYGMYIEPVFKERRILHFTARILEIKLLHDLDTLLSLLGTGECQFKRDSAGYIKQIAC